jgi:hypothetical protein
VHGTAIVIVALMHLGRLSVGVIVIVGVVAAGDGYRTDDYTQKKQFEVLHELKCLKVNDLEVDYGFWGF